MAYQLICGLMVAGVSLAILGYRSDWYALMMAGFALAGLAAGFGIVKWVNLPAF